MNIMKIKYSKHSLNITISKDFCFWGDFFNLTYFGEIIYTYLYIIV
jgi:hypothetical protein